MNAWRIPADLCIFCAFNPQANISNLVRRNVRAFSCTSKLARNNSRASRSKHGDNIIATLPRKHGRSTKEERLSKISTGVFRQQLLKESPTILLKEIKNALIELKGRLTSNQFNGNGVLRKAGMLDNEMQSWSSFQRRVYATFDPKTDLKGSAPLEEDTIRQCKEGYIRNKYALIRNALTDAYVHHILVVKGYGDDKKNEQLLELMRYPTEFFPKTRMLQRQIHLHVGPTNSGKTYNALKKLAEAESGFYAGPLRLLAHEVYSRFVSQGISCGLVTGDEVKGMETIPKLTAHTVEMVPLHREVEVGVIDEIQMLGSEDRGWAWTQALLGARAKELHLCGEERVVPLVRELTASMGDTLHIHRYERLNGLRAMSQSLKGDLKKLRKGDCVVCFSILSLHAMKKDIEKATGRNCAIVYGSLPPEIRSQQARLFNDPESTYDFLVASDAIGMGLNLSIKRIIFESIHKFNGKSHEPLEIPTLKQIAGRAGRYKSAHEDISNPGDTTQSQSPKQDGPRSVGLVTTLNEEDLSYVQRALDRNPEPLKAAGLRPPAEIVARYAATFPPETPYIYILKRLYGAISLNPRYFICDPKDEELVGRAIEGVGDLSTQDKYTITASPANMSDDRTVRILREIATAIATQQSGHLLDLQTMPLEILELEVTGERKLLEHLVILHRGLTLYIWLAFRFPDILESRILAEHAKHLTEQNMDQVLTLLSRDPSVRERLNRRDRRARGQLFKNDQEVLDSIMEGIGLQQEGAPGSNLAMDWESQGGGSSSDGGDNVPGGEGIVEEPRLEEVTARQASL